MKTLNCLIYPKKRYLVPRHRRRRQFCGKKIDVLLRAAERRAVGVRGLNVGRLFLVRWDFFGGLDCCGVFLFFLMGFWGFFFGKGDRRIFYFA